MHGSHRFATPAVGVLFATLTGRAAAAPPPVADFVRWPAHDTLVMSPDGEYLAATVPLLEGRAGVVLRRKDLSVSTTIKGGTDAYLDALIWANSRRLFMRFTRPLEFSAGRGWLPEIYAIDADGGNKGTMYGYIADLLPEDEDHVLLQVCDRYGCKRQAVYKADVKRLRKQGEELVLPGESPTVFADRHGDVRVASSADKQGFQVLHARADAESEWRVLHEEAKAGIRIDPLRIPPDDSLYAQVETRSGRTASTASTNRRTESGRARWMHGVALRVEDGRSCRPAEQARLLPHGLTAMQRNQHGTTVRPQPVPRQASRAAVDDRAAEAGSHPCAAPASGPSRRRTPVPVLIRIAAGN